MRFCGCGGNDLTPSLPAELRDRPSKRRRTRSEMVSPPQRQAPPPSRLSRVADAQGCRGLHQRVHGCVCSLVRRLGEEADWEGVGIAGKDITNTQLKELVERQGGQFVCVPLLPPSLLTARLIRLPSSQAR